MIFLVMKEKKIDDKKEGTSRSKDCTSKLFKRVFFKRTIKTNSCPEKVLHDALNGLKSNCLSALDKAANVSNRCRVLASSAGRNLAQATGKMVKKAVPFRIQRVPCSKRIQIVPKKKSKSGTYRKMSKWEREMENIMLPPTSPTSMRAQRILKNIVEAMHIGFGIQGVNTVQPAGDDQNNGMIDIKPGGLIGFHIEHLKGLNWEVQVVEDPRHNAFAYSDGKIIFLEDGRLRDPNFTDDEIAVTLGHEVQFYLISICTYIEIMKNKTSFLFEIIEL